jgi:hypothetical protein
LFVVSGYRQVYFLILIYLLMSISGRVFSRQGAKVRKGRGNKFREHLMVATNIVYVGIGIAVIPT